MTAWVVRATAPGLDSFASSGALALNCLVRTDLTGLSGADIARLGTSRAHSRELSNLSRLAEGDLVVATDSATRDVLVGRICGEYAHRPDLDPDHPHTRPVAWGPRVSRQAITSGGLRMPGIHVKALGQLEVDDASQQLLERAALGQLTAPSRPSRPARAASTVPAALVDEAAANALLAAVPRRHGSPVSWVDEQLSLEEQEQCRHTVRPCGWHTRHRYWLPLPLVRARADGPNVLVVGANPTCPDEPAPDNTTVNRVVAFGEFVRAASLAIANVASRRTPTFADLRSVPADERWGQRQELMLRAAMQQADLIVVAWGSDAAPWFPLEVERVSALLAEAQAAGAIVVDAFGRQRHPSRWPTVARDAAGSRQLLGVVCRWSRPPLAPR